ncbi:hypothetical protein [Pseudosporangium ferrugineum]|uniref:Uncharacterized protein n=1 Tax=Pseudosporangium ferrugineum TaxID=439699 RepID=A0A2T0RS63_9ACTN|nr:hypothetical protein [Pseudosporangium ferrugineum]PRY24036.1 hypothetical protein CLV70_114169 [Pseudosporangium ferrugineum]
MTAVLLDRPAATTAGCRFPTWCAGECRAGTPGPSGELNHWSTATNFRSYDLDERIGIELYAYENSEDGASPVAVYLSIGDDYLDEDGGQLTVRQARGLGEALLTFAPRLPLHEDQLIHAVDRDGEQFLTAEYRRERERRDCSVRPANVEFSIRPDGTRKHWIRERLSLGTTQRLARALIDAADQADRSNLEHGLVDK